MRVLVKAFLSASFDPQDEQMVEWFKKLLNLVGVEPSFADWSEVCPPIDKVRRNIAESDFVIVILSKKEKIDGKNIWKTSNWIQDEIGMAHGLKKPIIAFVEKGVDTSGILKFVTDYLEFERHDLNKKLLKMIHAIAQASKSPNQFPEYAVQRLTRPTIGFTPYIDRFVTYLIRVCNDLGDTEVIVRTLTESIDREITKRPQYISHGELSLKFNDLKVGVKSLDEHVVKIEEPKDLDTHLKRYQIAFYPPIRPGEMAFYSHSWFWRRIYPVEPNHFHFTAYSPIQTLFLIVEINQNIVDVEVGQNTVKYGDQELPSEQPIKRKFGNKWRIYWTVNNPPVDSVSTLVWLPKK